MRGYHFWNSPPRNGAPRFNSQCWTDDPAAQESLAGQCYNPREWRRGLFSNWEPRYLTPEHKFQLLITVLTVVPVTIVSAWALVNQLRQTTPRLQVLLSPIFRKTVTGEPLLGDDWPGVVVRNLSPFSLRICNVGFRIGRKHYSFGKPLLLKDSDLRPATWPYEVAPRARAGFYLNSTTDDGLNFTNAVLPILKDKLIWEISRGYVMTECNKSFVSPKMSPKTLRTLRRAAGVEQAHPKVTPPSG